MTGSILRNICVISIASIPLVSQTDSSQQLVDDKHFELLDVFGLEHASDPRISADGGLIVYVCNFMDIMKDRARSNLWIIDYDGSEHRPLTTGNQNDSAPRWSPDGDRLLYVSGADGSNQVYVRWMDTGQVAKLTNLTRSPSGLTWSPDGKWIAFSMLVPQSPESTVQLPQKPKDVEWAEPAVVIQKLKYRADGVGYLEDGSRQLFVLSAEGGAPRQVTAGAFDHSGALAWSVDSKALIFSANRHEDWEYDPSNPRSTRSRWWMAP